MRGNRRRIVDVSPEEDRLITRAAERDPDNPPLTEAELAEFRPVSEVMPELVEAHRRRAAHLRLSGKTRKQPLVLRLDADIISFFRASGQGWQQRINQVLREYVERARQPKKKA